MNNTFKLYYISSLVAVIGNAVSQIAVSWYISSMISHAHLAYLIASTFLCTFLFSVLLSPIIDRNNPIRIYRISVVGRIILLIVTIVLLKLLEGSIGPLVLLLIIQSILTVMGSNTSFKIVKYIVPEEKLLKANALLTANSRTGYLIGMFLGGILIKYLNIDTVLIIEVIGYCLSLGLLFFISINNYVGSQNTSKYFKNIWEGFSYIANNKWIMVVILIAVIANMAITPTNTLLAPYVQEVLKESSLTFSVIEILMIVGGILSSLITSKISKHLEKKGILLNLFITSASLQSISVILLGFHIMKIPVFIYFFIIGVSVAIFNIPFVTILQKNIPSDISGRVWSLLVAISTLFSSLFYYLSGYLVSVFSLKIVFFNFGLISLIFLVLTFLIFGKLLKKSIKV